MEVLGVSIIPKWLINYSWSIAIVFGTFLERTKMRPNLDPRSPHLSPKYFKSTRNYGNILEKMIFTYLRIWDFGFFGRFVYQAFWNFEIRNFEIGNYENEIWKSGNLEIENDNFGNWHVEIRKNLKFWKWKTWKLRNFKFGSFEY